jgi:hypothetical protein
VDAQDLYAAGLFQPRRRRRQDFAPFWAEGATSQPLTKLPAVRRRLSVPVIGPQIAQLIAAVGELCADIHGRGLWDATDVELLEAVWQFQRNYEAAVTMNSDDAIS